MRTRLLVCAALLAVTATVHTAQDQDKDQKKKKTDDNKTITVTGCVEGGYLRVHEVDVVGSYVERYRLAGSKALLKEMAAEHNGHVLEVTGRVTDAPGTEHAGHTTQIGKKTKIYTGAKDVPTIPTGDNTSKLEVTSYRETQESCKGKS